MNTFKPLEEEQTGSMKFETHRLALDFFEEKYGKQFYCYDYEWEDDNGFGKGFYAIELNETTEQKIYIHDAPTEYTGEEYESTVYIDAPTPIEC